MAEPWAAITVAEKEWLLYPSGLPGTAGRGPACPVVWEAGGETLPPTRLDPVSLVLDPFIFRSNTIVTNVNALALPRPRARQVITASIWEKLGATLSILNGRQHTTAPTRCCGGPHRRVMDFASARRAARIVKTAAACHRSRYQCYGQKSQHALQVVQRPRSLAPRQ